MGSLLAVLETMLRPVKRVAGRVIDARIRNAARLATITEFDERDIFIAGYPKSGNTWAQNLVAGLVYGVDLEYAPDTLIQELIPDVHYKRYYKRFSTPMYFKSHHLPQPQYRRVIYLLRDGRDVLVSYYHFLCAYRRATVDFAELVRKGPGDGPGGLPCKWQDHVRAWMENPYQAEMLVIKYEDMKKDALAQMRRLCQFVALERDDAFLERVIEKASFSKMRKKEVQQGWDNPTWPKDKIFTRRGVVGSYKDEMPPAVLALFLQEAGETLKQYGYD